jgi:hypothetical protein
MRRGRVRTIGWRATTAILAPRILPGGLADLLGGLALGNVVAPLALAVLALVSRALRPQSRRAGAAAAAESGTARVAAAA